MYDIAISPTGSKYTAMTGLPPSGGQETSVQAHDVSDPGDTFSSAPYAGEATGLPQTQVPGRFALQQSALSEAFFDLPGGPVLWKCTLNGHGSSAACLGPEGTVYTGIANRLCAVKDGKKIWEFSTRGFTTDPCLGPDGTVYVGSQDHKLYAFKDGKKLWEFEAGSWVSSPAVGSDGTVYFGSGDGKLYAVKDGEEAWSYRTQWSIFSPIEGIESKPSVGPDNTVYFGCRNGMLYAVKKGRKKWSIQAGEHIGKSSPCLGPDNTVYIGSFDTRLYAVKDGKQLWEFKTGGSIDSSPCLGSDGTVYVGSRDGNLYAVKEGKPLWSASLAGMVDSSPCQGSDGTVYVGSHGVTFTDGVHSKPFGSLAAVKDGKVLWQHTTKDYINSAPSVASDGTVYTSCYDGCLYALTDPEKAMADAISKALSGEGAAADAVIEEDGWLIIDDVKMKKHMEKLGLNFSTGYSRDSSN